MAGRAQNEEPKNLPRHPNDPTGPQDSTVVVPGQAVRETAAKLYGQGFERAKIARMMVDHLVPNGRERPLEQRLSQARTKLRNWEMTDSFRDMVWRLSVVKLDMASPAILTAVGKKAKRGNVQAMRLALEVTGRHNPKGEQAPAQIIVAIEGVPRPMTVRSGDESVTIDADGAMVDEDQDV